MSTNTSPMSMPGKAYTTKSAALKMDAPFEAKAETMESKAKSGDDLQASATSAESTSEMYIKPFEDLSNPQGYTVFSPF